jgi:hypothetical protein
VFSVSPLPFERGAQPYSILHLQQRSEGCFLAWFDPSRSDFEFNRILEVTAEGSIVMGGDFETYEIGRIRPVRQ